jgi:chromosome segregation ATPase
MRYLGDHGKNQHPKCPMCRAPIHRGDQPLKLFISDPANSSSPGASSRADSSPNASLRALRKEHEALKSSSRAQIQELTRRNNSLSAVNSELSEAYRISSTSVKRSRQTIRTLATDADTARGEVDILKMEITRLEAKVGELAAYKKRSEILLKQFQDALESTRQATYSRIQHLTNENANKLHDQQLETDRLIRDANRHFLDKAMECRALTHQIQDIQRRRKFRGCRISLRRRKQ